MISGNFTISPQKTYLFHDGCGDSDMVMMCYHCGQGQDDDTVEIHTNVVLLSGSPSLFWPIFTHQRHSADTSPRREDTAGKLRDYKEESLSIPREWVVSLA